MKQFPIELVEAKYRDGIIMLMIGGSQLHGAKLDGTDDTDYYGVFIDHPEKVLGLDIDEHFVFTTGGKKGGNIASDIDITLYSLKKWARLAAKGNPSVLHFLFAPPMETAGKTWPWKEILKQRQLFFAKTHVQQFLGYANAQLDRLQNKRGGKDCNRPYLEEQHGYDTKYAMHLIRLLQEAKEFLETGNITFPRPNKDELITIRTGKYKLFEIRDWADQIEQEVLASIEKSPLPEKVDRTAISKLLAEVYLDFWNEN